MRKLFTLLAFLTCFLGAKAAEIVDAEVDFSKYSDISEVKFGGWGASESARARLSIKDGCLHFESTEATDPSWDCQFFPIGGVSAEVDVTYTLHFKIKGDHAGNVSMLGFGQTPYGQFAITTDWVEGTVDYVCTDAGGGDILMQCGDWVGTWDIAYLKITHEGKEQRPAVWQQWLTDDGQSIIPGQETGNKYVGDAEFGQWPDWALEKDGDININWRTDNAPKICAWSLTMGKNFDDQCADFGQAADRARPYPTDIEEDPDQAGNHIFAVHVEQIDCIDDCDGDKASTAWSNQFWIQAPRSFKAGETVRIKFRYKAEHACSAGTQWHQKNPSVYLFWNALGDVSFTEEWQEFEKTATIPADANGTWSLAFNLCSDATNGRTANVFYFDDLSWESMVLDEGLFAAASNTASGLEYDYDNAVELTYDEAESYYVATVGTAGKKDSWVNEIMISTIRGNDGAFKGATIKPTGNPVGEDNWVDYTESSNAKIKVPAGVYKICVDTEQKQMNFIQIEGEAAQEPVDIVTNATEVVVNGLEREPTASEQPADEEAGTAAGTGQPWDNQFFIVANREFKTGEKVTLKFKYKGSCEAKTSTQLHGAPGAYVYWNAIGDVVFKEEWQDFEKTWEISAGDGGAEITCKSIAFNMAEIKEACKYELKDFQWYLSDDGDAEGKTAENLINATGTENFWVKEGAGTAPYQFGAGTGGNGDANGDGTVNAADIVEIVNYIMGSASDKFNEAAADVNGDGVVNAADIVAVVNIIMAAN